MVRAYRRAGDRAAPPPAHAGSQESTHARSPPAGRGTRDLTGVYLATGHKDRVKRTPETVKEADMYIGGGIILLIIIIVVIVLLLRR
jgi:hypothetical protein